MDSQLFDIWIVVAIFVCGLLAIYIQYLNAKNAEKKVSKEIAAFHTKQSQIHRKHLTLQRGDKPVRPRKHGKPLRRLRVDAVNKIAAPRPTIIEPSQRIAPSTIVNQTVNQSVVNDQDSVTSDKCSPREYRSKQKNKIIEIKKIQSADERDFVFIDTETSSLESPHIIEIALLSFSGTPILSRRVAFNGVISDQALSVHRLSTHNELPPLSVIELEDTLIQALTGKTLIAYNAEFDLRALKTTLHSDKIAPLIQYLELNSVCMMSAFQELFRFRKRKSLVSACEHLNINALPSHNAINDCLMLYAIYSQVKSLFPFAESWLAGFEEINWRNLNLQDGTSLIYWCSRDGERHVLYTPTSILGSEKIAELSDQLKVELKDFGSALFYIFNRGNTPDISIKVLSKEEAKTNYEIEKRQRQNDYHYQLRNPKMPSKGTLTLPLSLECQEANLKRTPPIPSNQIYRPFLQEGDLMYLPSLNYSANFNFKDVEFVDATGQSYGRLLNINENWTRVFGILMKGYRAEIQVISSSKQLKVKISFYP